jgi:methionine-rich copper-binding protein CopC
MFVSCQNHQAPRLITAVSTITTFAPMPTFSTRRLPSLKSIASSSAVLLAVLATSQAAFAHAHLKTAEPAVNSTVATAPTSLSLHFTEGVDPHFSGVEVSGPATANATAPVVAQKITLNPADNTNMLVALPANLATGQYHVKWHALATDGHKTTGDYSFTVK